ncbi:MAG: ATP-dependent helicase HrpB [Pseudomonadota bacterium]
MVRQALPIDDVLPDIVSTLRQGNRLVLAAPPGAGKTTRVPLALLEPGAGIDGRILVLEPRRIAARAAAERMASQLGEAIGATVGLSTRIDRRVSPKTRIEIITDGLFTRRILADPSLEGVGAVLFDEFHERSLTIDLALALACETQAVFNSALKLVVMSATLETERVCAALDAPLIESAGRMFPVEGRYAGRPPDRLEPHLAKIIRRALREEEGSILVFLPGAAEIRRVGDALAGDSPPNSSVHPLFGALSPAEQDAAIRPAPDGHRKIVLATDIAESALTIDGVRIVIDAGLARLPEAQGRNGRTQLVTVRAALSSVDQRRGRAGRTAPGVCYRLWDEPETRGLAKHVTPEILRADLAGLALSLADWGERDPARLTWLDPPPPGGWRGACDRLVALGALDPDGRLTERGRALAALPLPPEHAALIVSQPDAAQKARAAEIAALMSERGIGGQGTDLGQRLAAFRRDKSQRGEALRRQARRWGGGTKASGSPALCLARAWPHALARRRPGDDPRYITAGGAAGRLDPADPLSSSPWLVIADSIGSASSPRITLAAPISEPDALAITPPETVETATFDPATRSFIARRVKRIGAIILSETPLPAPSGETARLAILDAIEKHGFAAIGAEGGLASLLARIAMLRQVFGEPWPDWIADGLAETVSEWLGPTLGTGTTLPKPQAVCDAIIAGLPWPLPQELKTLAPGQIPLPSGRSAPVTYTGDQAPLVEARVQELFGDAPHPSIASGRVPVTLSLLSPARRQVALTKDLPGFWNGGYQDMAKDMRAQYPKHDWPDDPASARAHPGHTKAQILQTRS